MKILDLNQEQFGASQSYFHHQIQLQMEVNDQIQEIPASSQHENAIRSIFYRNTTKVIMKLFL